MKTKINHPFIYFLMEPNVVIVYKVETQKYLTAMDLSSREEWDTFELNNEDEFISFDHKKSKRLEGRAYFILQDDMERVVEEINKYIQKYRKLTTVSANQQQMGAVHIVSSEFAAGSLKVGLERPKIVIGFPDFFSIGPLWKLDEKIGQTLRNEWLEENINFGQEDNYLIKFNNTLRELEDIPSQAPIYIWYGNNASEQTGYRFILHLLKDKTNEIYLINSTELYESFIISKNEELQIIDTGQIDPKNISLIFEKTNSNRPILNKERIQFQKEWETLSKTKDVLRLWINDEIKGVPEQHYDPIIIKILQNLHSQQENKDFIKTGRVIEELLTEMDEFVSVFFLEYRIRHLIYSGVLQLKGIPKSMRHYSVKIRN